MLVECADFALGVLRECLRVDFPANFLAPLDNAIQFAFLATFKFLGLMRTCEILKVWFLVPHLEQECATMVLQRIEICVDIDVGPNEVMENVPSRLHAL